MMNSIRLMLTAFLCAIGMFAAAQKFGYVDTKYILSHMPEYQAAQNEINKLSNKWQQEIEEKYAAIERLEQSYQAEKILLTDEMKKKREEEIEAKRQEAKEMQKKKFGVDGELFKKREELIKPIQDKIFEAIVDVASQSALMCVFDKANHSNLLYTNPKHDISDKVLKKMGLKPGDVLEDEEESKDGANKDADPNKGGSGGGNGGKDNQQSPPQKGGSVPANRGGKP